jgi:hypothetical protein
MSMEVTGRFQRTSTLSDRNLAMTVKLLSLLFFIPFSEAKHAKVYFPFVVPPTQGGYKAVFETNSRLSFPEGDILVSEITFVGVKCNGKNIPYHAHNMHLAETSELVFHHSILHQGSLDDLESWQHFKPEDNSTWSHGAIMYGTTPKRTSFEPYGIRMRPESPIFTCIHAKNMMDVEVVFVAEWAVEYEMIDEDSDKERSLVTGWFSLPPINPAPLQPGQKKPNRVLIENDLVMVTNAKLKGWILHHHGWLHELVVKVENKIVFRISMDDPDHPLPDNDDTVHWISPHKGEGGVALAKNQSIQIEVVAENPVDHLVGPMGLSLYFTCDDGMDILEHMTDMFLPPQPRSLEFVDQELMEKVTEWNQHLFV